MSAQANATDSVARVGPKASEGSPLGGRFRRDIEGLRAVAILLVVAYHVGAPLLVSGFIGVDVFFVISGFLITGLLLREFERSGRLSLVGFYARRIRRLLPAASLVIVSVAAATAFFGPVTQRRVFGGDFISAVGYFSNWRFAARSVDYLSQDIGPSPVLHFWSLSVEEQFYLIWPILLIVAGLVARRACRSRRGVIAIVLSAVVVPSFVLSVVWSRTSGGQAFFVTPTRLWESRSWSIGGRREPLDLASEQTLGDCRLAHRNGRAPCRVDFDRADR